MKKFETKFFDLSGRNIAVDVQEVPNVVPAFRVTARVEDVVVELTHTLGPVDGDVSAIDPDHVQKAIDELRGRAASHAFLRHTLKRQLAGAK